MEMKGTDAHLGTARRQKMEEPGTRYVLPKHTPRDLLPLDSIFSFYHLSIISYYHPSSD